MKEIIMSNGNIKSSKIGLGCTRLSTMDKTSVNKLINTALKCGINFFDHADIYRKGKSEEIFSEALSMSSSLRENIILNN